MMREIAEVRDVEKDVKTWHHARKGRIRGRLVQVADDWTDIELVGDQVMKMVSAEGDVYGESGTIIRVRTAFLTEVKDG